jgi:hypothetical protein
MYWLNDQDIFLHVVSLQAEGVLQIVTMSYIEVKQSDPEDVELNNLNPEVKQSTSERCQLVIATLSMIVIMSLIFLGAYFKWKKCEKIETPYARHECNNQCVVM